MRSCTLTHSQSSSVLKALNQAVQQAARNCYFGCSCKYFLLILLHVFCFTLWSFSLLIYPLGEMIILDREANLAGKKLPLLLPVLTQSRHYHTWLVSIFQSQAYPMPCIVVLSAAWSHGTGKEDSVFPEILGLFFFFSHHPNYFIMRPKDIFPQVSTKPLTILYLSVSQDMESVVDQSD